ncbi:Transcription factor che-1 [Eumeta japonica]|uniref:Transcription factor che-1 n=1 Tax=Eumeta variegata TaxID=151549 RepID=A0A4C1ZMN8_EUMVA|nr:Transcription factor che-1 [Eumeta japonica]
MDSENFFLLQIEKHDDVSEADSYTIQVYEIKGDDKEVVEDPLLLQEIMDNIQCMSSEDLTENMTSIGKKEDDEQDFENYMDYYNADNEDASNDNQIYNQNPDSTDDDELDLNTAEEIYNKLNETQKKIVDFAIQKVVKNSNIPLYNEDVFGVSYVDDTDIWSDEIKKEELVCGSEYADLVKLARSLASSERKRMLRKQKRAFKMPCEVCGKMISQANINIHMTVHTGEKKFACTKCPAKFKTARGLSAHTNAHLGRRPFQCDQCPKAYTSDTALRLKVAETACAGSRRGAALTGGGALRNARDQIKRLAEPIRDVRTYSLQRNLLSLAIFLDLLDRNFFGCASEDDYVSFVTDSRGGRGRLFFHWL